MKTTQHAITFLTRIALAGALSCAPIAALCTDSMQATVPAASSARVDVAYGKLPLSFEVNQGQTDPRVQFLARGPGQALYLMPSGAALTFQTRTVDSMVRITFEGADPDAPGDGREPLPGIVNYFIGEDPSTWRTNIPTYQKVAYTQVYPGIDLVYYGSQGQLEYDLVVAPGADPKQITLAFEGAERIALDEQGDLVLTMTRSSTDVADVPPLRLHKPIVYQKDAHGEKQLLAGAYVLVPSEAAVARASTESSPAARQTPRVAFQLAAYDATRPLVIDPVLSWATYLGGFGSEAANGIAVDQAGDVYVTGSTGQVPMRATSTAGPVVANLTAVGTSDWVHWGLVDASSVNRKAKVAPQIGGLIVLGPAPARFGSGDPAWNRLSWTDGTPTKSATKFSGGLYFQGVGNGYKFTVPADTTQRTLTLYVGGWMSTSRIEVTLSDDSVAPFVTEFGSANSVYSQVVTVAFRAARAGQTLKVRHVQSYGPGGNIGLQAAALSTQVGGNPSPGFPVTADSLQPTFGGSSQSTHNRRHDAFVAKLNGAGTALIYATYLGGSGNDEGNAIAVDRVGNAYVTGVTDTQGSGFPGTANSAIQNTYGGGTTDAFVTELNATGTEIVYSTYLGGNGSEGTYSAYPDDEGRGIAVDVAGEAYVTGLAGPGSAFPRTVASGISQPGGFVAKLNATGTALVYSIYAGGGPPATDVGNAIALDAGGNAYITGGGAGAFVTKINAAGTAIVYSKYFGSGGGSAIAVDSSGMAYVTGCGDRSTLPTESSPIQSTFGGGQFDAFVAKLNAAGTALVYSTYLGGSNTDCGTGIAVDAAGDAYVTGGTEGTNVSGSGYTGEGNFPSAAGSPIQSIFGGGAFDAFVTKLNAAGTALVYSTYLGGNGWDVGMGIAVSQAGEAYVAGATDSRNFPGTTGSPIQSVHSDGHPWDAFVAMIATNARPSINPIGDKTVAAGSPLAFTVTANDPDGPLPLSMTMANSVPALPPAATYLDNGDGTGGFAWTPSTADVGSYQVTFAATDGGGLAAQRTITIAVTGPVPAGSLNGSVAIGPVAANLTSVGQVDWAHWGLLNASSVNRKAGVTQQISNVKLLGAAPGRFGSGDPLWSRLSWTDGTPTASKSNFSGGIYFAGNGNGYRLTVPADATQRTLKLYVGGWQSNSRIEATLSDASAAPFVVTFGDLANVYSRVVTLTFAAASSGQTLTIRHTQSGKSGNIGLQAAALSQ